jgi:nucleotide-binding universal stress UspA family protein
MTYRSLMVHVDIGGTNDELLRLSGDLAEHFEARAIGITACMPLQTVYYTDAYIIDDFIEQDRLEVEKQMQLAEQTFRAAMQNRARCVEWRSAYRYEPIAAYLARHARAADLILIDRNANGKDLDYRRRVHITDFLMAVGRPVLVVQTGSAVGDIGKVVIGWKDTREAQRAVASALPLLKRASEITIVSIVPEDDLAYAHKADKEVAIWLKEHGVTAAIQPTPANGDDASQLNAIAEEKGAGLVVAGAYGHSRLTEWILGGVTRDLLRHSKRCAFLSH